MLHANFMAVGYVLKNRSYCRSKFYIAGIMIFDVLCCCDLDFDPMTFIYELNRIPGDTPDV